MRSARFLGATMAAGLMLAGTVQAPIAEAAPSAAAAVRAPAAASVASALPGGFPAGLRCSWQGKGVTPSGQIISRKLTYSSSGIAAESHAYGPGRLPFVPRTWVPPTGVGGFPFVNDYFDVTSSDGYYYNASAVGQTSYNDVKVTVQRARATWGGVRLIASTYDFVAPTGGRYIYGVHDSGANYRYIEGDTAAPHHQVLVGAGGWQGVRTLAYDRVVKLAGTNRLADVLLATTADGQLVEYTIPHDKPTQWTRKSLKTSTWGTFASVYPSFCSVANGGSTPVRMLVGIKPNGDVYGYLDKNRNDGSGADFVGLGRIAVGWTDKVFAPA